jgi:hypothetical protein
VKEKEEKRCQRRNKEEKRCQEPFVDGFAAVG